ncbi:conserved protein of unknown function [Oenococcus oeni]|uniref:Uncharacterized protein n=2 Tax=Oenococcus oeni TaxID=1247 RepID=A0AAQ2US55_OENOE|nr:hypothetical protein AWRIB429_0502 [Oenococcus oeni AWRIB429]KZD13737.1 hypothetical protein AC229_0394 [Oenococcus oeni]SYW00763.1 conserved hypothetical protein [Oenococcus oeni]SYW01898.1 conserved hypothetical protein [Oenococcus oeni]SYW07808.1 conserved hypothetical protein [Oenococcus oeni]
MPIYYLKLNWNKFEKVINLISLLFIAVFSKLNLRLLVKGN